MRILITGGNGQLGLEWRDFLNEQGSDFLALSSAELDITDKKAVEEKLSMYQPAVIINCAAYTKVDQAEEDVNKVMLVNATAVSHLAKLCYQLNIKLVHYSTDYIFAGKESDRKALPAGYPEDHQPQPINVYGKSKLLGEQALQSSGCTYLIIRVSWLCGQYGSNFVKTMLRLAAERDVLKVVNDQYGCPTFAENVVRNTFQLLKSNENGIYNLASAGEITWYDFARAIFSQKSIDIKVIAVGSDEFPSKAKRPAYSLLNTQKIERSQGIRIIDWRTGLNKLLEQLNEN